MEGSPTFPNSEISTDDSPETASSKDKKKKSVESIILNPETEGKSVKKEVKESEATLWQKLIGQEPEATKDKKDEPKAETETQAKTESLDFTKEAEPVDDEEAPTDELSLIEAKSFNQKIATEHLNELPDEPDAADTAVEQLLTEVKATGEVDEAFAKAAAEQGASAEAIDELLKETIDLDELESEEEPEEVEEAGTVVGTRTPTEGELRLHTRDTGPETATGSSGRGGRRSGGTVPPQPPPPGATPPAKPSGPRWGNPNAGPNTGPYGNYYPSMIPLTRWRYYQYLRHDRPLLETASAYFWGRRAGRIKSEKQLMPVQKKLEKQVKKLHAELVDREAKLRMIVTEKDTQLSMVEQQPVRGTSVERPKVGKPETRLGLEKPKRIERLGHVVVDAEAKPKELSPEYKAETMSRAELLTFSEKIMIEGASLRQIYETHLIGERALRYLVGEHLKGRDIRRDLRHEMVEREIDFERDPILRDKVHKNLSADTATSAALTQLIRKAGIDTESKDRADELVELEEKRQTQKNKKPKHRRLADAAFISLIVILSAIIAMLIISRH